jgi:hypothetical protein
MPEPQQDTWLKLVALTVIVLAGAAGFAALKASRATTKSRIYAVREAQEWQDYQVESIKKDSYGLNRDVLTFMKHKGLATKIKGYETEMTRLNQERDQIKARAQHLATQEETLEKQAGNFGLAVILLQLAIMGAAAAFLSRKKILWFLGLGLGVWGLVYVGLGLML